MIFVYRFSIITPNITFFSRTARNLLIIIGQNQSPSTLPYYFSTNIINSIVNLSLNAYFPITHEVLLVKNNTVKRSESKEFD